MGVLDLDPASLGEVVVRTLVVYVVLLLGLRVAGKRELGQMTTFDLVVVLVISNAVQNAMVGSNTSLTGGLVAAATLLVVNGALWRLGIRSGTLREWMRGEPTLLVHDGALIREHLRSEGVDEDEVMQALREHGVDDLSEVRSAVLEVDGTISVIPAGAGSSRTRRRIRGRKPAG
jgi:uncharacterized membrane protein YcaP (DUF421 family)